MISIPWAANRSALVCVRTLFSFGKVSRRTCPRLRSPMTHYAAGTSLRPRVGQRAVHDHAHDLERDRADEEVVVDQERGCAFDAQSIAGSEVPFDLRVVALRIERFAKACLIQACFGRKPRQADGVEPRAARFVHGVVKVPKGAGSALRVCFATRIGGEPRM